MTTAESEGEVQEAFAAQITRANLHHIWWLCGAGMAYVLFVQVLSFIHPIPLQKAAELNNGFELVVGLVSLVLVRKFRTGALHPKWPRVFVVAFAALLLSDMTVYYFSVLSVYGHTSVYVVGVMIAAVAIILPPRIFVPLLLINHGVFLGLLGLGRYPEVLLIPAATDASAGVLIAGLASWFLYRAHWGNFCQERVISAGAVELQARNRELARLHLLELDETAAARLAEEKARMEVLRYQLNPHFLFNALTSICAQLPADPDHARATIERLADFCQLTLFRPEGGEGVNPTLEQELKMISAYLDIEQTRWGELLKIAFDLEPGIQSERLPPFVLLPLVENALKYGRATSRSGLEIRVAVRREEGSLLLEIANTGRWVESADRGSTPSLGIGLENLRQRLQRYYPGTHEFTTKAADGWVRVRLRLALPQRQSGPAI
jgi:signal transduction histidine kinase